MTTRFPALRIPSAGSLFAWGFIALVLLMPTPVGMTPAAHRLLGVTAAMVVLWMNQALPIAVTSLLPLILYPLLGIRPLDEVSRSYLDPNVFLFLGGFFLALGIERWGLHRRLALHIVHLVGCSPRRLVFGFLLATAFLSMWMSNTATAMLMTPIGLALLASLRQDVEAARGLASSTTPVPADGIGGLDRLDRGLLLAIAYGASIGGFSTPIGTPTNIAYLRFWEGHPQFAAGPRTSTAEWMLVFVPVSLLLLICTWVVLTWRMPPLPAAAATGRDFFRERLRALGRATFEERAMLAVFSATALLWMTRSSIELGESFVIPGWSEPLANWLTSRWGVPAAMAKSATHDAVVAMSMATLAFCLPARADESGKSRRLLEWDYVESRMPWGMVLLIGGGFAVAEAFDATELSQWIGAWFEDSFRNAGVVELVFATCLLATFLTEFTTNVVLVNTLLPVLAAAAISLRIDPRLLLIPATIASSCGFMMPIGTPPNAIAFSTGRIPMRDMMRFGFLLNVAGVILISLATLTLLIPVFDIEIGGPPEWLPEAPDQP